MFILSVQQLVPKMVDKQSERLQPFKDAATLVKTVNVFKGGSKVADKVVRIPTMLPDCPQCDVPG